jgi:hypothetical protein
MLQVSQSQGYTQQFSTEKRTVNISFSATFILETPVKTFWFLRFKTKHTQNMLNGMTGVINATEMERATSNLFHFTVFY